MIGNTISTNKYFKEGLIYRAKFIQEHHSKYGITKYLVFNKTYEYIIDYANPNNVAWFEYYFVEEPNKIMLGHLEFLNTVFSLEEVNEETRPDRQGL